MSIKLKTTSNGSVSLTPEDTASDVVLTVPATAGVVVNDATLRTELNASGSAPIYACRAWVNFDGTTATPSTIRGSGNVSSVTRLFSGKYSVNLTNAMPDTNFSTVATVGTPLGASNISAIAAVDQSQTKSTTLVPIGTVLGSNGNTYTGYNEISVSIFR